MINRKLMVTTSWPNSIEMALEFLDVVLCLAILSDLDAGELLMLK